MDQGSGVLNLFLTMHSPLIPGPLMVYTSGTWALQPCVVTGRVLQATMDQGSVLAVHVFGSLSIYFTPQPEVVPLF